MLLAICLPPVPNGSDCHYAIPVVNDIQNPVISDSQAVLFTTCKFLGTSLPRVVTKGIGLFPDSSALC